MSKVNFKKGDEVKFIPDEKKYTINGEVDNNSQITIHDALENRTQWVSASKIKLISESMIYHIDEPNQSYEISREANEGKYFYAILFHPSFMDIKLLKKEDENKFWFRDKESCLDARIERLERKLELEKSWKKRKI